MKHLAENVPCAPVDGKDLFDHGFIRDSDVTWLENLPSSCARIRSFSSAVQYSILPHDFSENVKDGADVVSVRVTEED